MPVCAVAAALMYSNALQEVRAQDDVSRQIWTSVSCGKKVSQQVYVQASLEGKMQTDGGENWRSLSITPHVDYYPNRWLDLIGELFVGDTLQFDEASNFELTPRIGIKFHFLKQALGHYASNEHVGGGPLEQMAWHSLERVSLSRFDLAVLLRIEARNIWYSNAASSDHSGRMRGRFEFKAALNRKSLAEMNTVYLLSDIEYFEPVGDDVIERYPSKTRIRAGVGYRLATNHTLEVLYVRDFTRDAPNGQETLGTQAFSLNWKMKF